MRRLLLVVGSVTALLMVTLSCDSVTKPKLGTPSSWQRYQLDGFSFYGPAQLQRDPWVHGIDSYFGMFRMPGMVVAFDYGMYSGCPPGGEKVDVHGAYVATLLVPEEAAPDSFPYLAQLCARQHPSHISSLAISVRAASVREREIGLMILRSVAFDESPGVYWQGRRLH
jgi:hypothetical protein